MPGMPVNWEAIARALQQRAAEQGDDNYDDRAAAAENQAEDPRAYTDEGYQENENQPLPDPTQHQEQLKALTDYVNGNESGDTSLYEAWKRKAQQNPPQLVGPQINPRFR